jgi:hypothetical protein
MDTFFITCGKHNAIKLFFLDLPNILEMVHDHDAHGELICFRSGPRVTLHHWTTPQGSRLTFLSAARLAEKDSSDQQIEQIVVKGKCHASGMYILMYHNSAYISNYFQIFPTYETNTGWKLEAWGSQAISSKLVFFFFVFLEEAMPSGAATSPLFQPHWDILPKGTLLSSVTCAGRFYASLGP